jgi:hypothetical protein
MGCRSVRADPVIRSQHRDDLRLREPQTSAWSLPENLRESLQSRVYEEGKLTPGAMGRLRCLGNRKCEVCGYAFEKGSISAKKTSCGSLHRT